MTRLIIAAGGGGDAVAAAMLDVALYGSGGGSGGDGGGGDDRSGGRAEPAVVLTYAWDRLLIDPVPGPRGARHFDGLDALTPGVSAVPAGARPVAPAGSTLPRLAAELPQTFALLDPYRGAEGVVRQLRELVGLLAPESIDLLDVGGDILARGDEPTLKSPLADALTLAACRLLDAPVRLLVAGPGLDGELPPDTVRERLGPVVHTFTPENVAAVGPVLEWHPSEATGMLAATARGVRGTCEMRDAGLPVALTGEGPTVREAGLDAAFLRNRLALALAATTSLDEAEACSREVCGYSEIDYEREKAQRLKERERERLRERVPAELDPRAVLSRLERFEAGARDRGVTHTTFRRITEYLGLDGSLREDLRRLLIDSRPEQYAAPLWRISVDSDGENDGGGGQQVRTPTG
ncbi:DUF1152 domain-containing protein [Streptomyces sp. TS71-3]|uniref:DUF1152 domain-containing protein n=1 Tax=Streptomyces sp. TS71-3 TaxID=2733862 RepID=UPI001B120AC6|nr:DUF1152 domain-containing protein [Streptomyces sp. TS71-3]GHJ40150.1 hypothetical protein Sm713_57590 [Streptomyces sp. TS71-3]